MRKALAFLLALAPLPACEPATVAPALGEVFSRVDARRVLECAGMASDPKAAAACLGAAVMTPAIDAALAKAAELAEKAKEASGPAGADDMPAADRAQLARDLDAALGVLGAEIESTYAEQ